MSALGNAAVKGLMESIIGNIFEITFNLTVTPGTIP